LGVNPMTISKAYSFLEKEDVVERRPGRPLIVKPLREEQMMAEKIDQLRQDLQSTVRIVQQLSITHDEALALFRQMLKAEEE
jgi:DNA-binding transcriptional regulator YhcF (GntR family)